MVLKWTIFILFTFTDLSAKSKRYMIRYYRYDKQPYLSMLENENHVQGFPKIIGIGYSLSWGVLS